MTPTLRLRGFGCPFQPMAPTMTRTPRLRGFGCLFQLTAPAMTRTAPTMTPNPRLRGFGCPFQPMAPTMTRTLVEGFRLSIPTYGPYDGPYCPYGDA